MKDESFTLITVALERNFDDPASYIREADPDHPSLIDTQHRVAELYDVDNVPTAIWIDEDRRIVRPNDVVFGRGTFDFFAGLDSDEHRQALKRWVRDEDQEYIRRVDEDRTDRVVPSEEKLDARNEYRLAQWLYENDYESKSREHFGKAIDLAPDDVAIRRGSMRMRGENPMGLGFLRLYLERWWKGLNYYNPLTT